MDSITHNEILQQKIMVNITELEKDIDGIIESKLRDSIGDRCLESGYINKDSIKMIRRSLGKFDAEHLKGDFIYIVEYECSITLPTEGVVLKGEVKSKNKMGLYVMVGDKNQIRVLLPKDYHSENEKFNQAKVNDEIEVQIVACDFNLGSTFINCVGVLEEKDE